MITANIPAGTNSNTVTLQSLSFAPATVGFNVYRGTIPQRLYRIASGQPIAATYTDTGAGATLNPAPDANFDHANVYWRFELQPAAPVDIVSTNTVGNSQLQMAANVYRGTIARISAGTGEGQELQIAGNTATTLTLTQKWGIEPDTTSSFSVVESSWHYGSTGTNSPVSFSVPDRPGASVEVSGRAANVRNEETDPALSPLTVWQIGGVSVVPVDQSVPPAPSFGLVPTGNGSVQVQAIGFGTLVNTRTITAGTMTIGYWDELNGPTVVALSAPVAATDSTVQLNTANAAQVGDLLQVEAEVMVVQQISLDGLTYTVARGAYATAPGSYEVGVPAWDLSRKTFILPFFPDFFGSPASGSYSYPLSFPDKRIVTADLFMTNARGNSEAAQAAFTDVTDYGLRTLSGGQLTLQIDGPLAIQTNAAPPLTIDSTHSVRDVFAMLNQAPTGTSVELEVTQNGQPYCSLTIPVNQTSSNVVDGATLGTLEAQAQIGLNVVSVSQTQYTAPGSDLTVTIRL